MVIIMNHDYIKSPLNYIGGKYRILDQIIPKFPKDINKFVDLFGGGFNVGINVDANIVVYNDIISQICELLHYFSNNSSSSIIKKIEATIEENGLNKNNNEAFLNLRNKYNHSLYSRQSSKIIDFYCLILYSFNYQIRFNKSMEFNTPFGKNRSSFNSNIKRNLKRFIERLNNMNVQFSNSEFLKFDFSELSSNDLVYCDPPYLITTGSYNDGNRGIKDWTVDDEKALLNLLDNLNKKNIKFALSNVFVANGKKNDILIEWSKKYNVIEMKNSFNNSNYRRKSKNDIKEVLVTNYEVIENE